MHGFDHDACYYRVLATRPGHYDFRPGEPEAIVEATRAYDHPFYEFDDLASVGNWMFLGDRVLVLQIPPDAQVEANRPRSQGGCMKYSASRVARVGELSVPGLMRAYEAAGVCPAILHLADQYFEDGMALPACGVRRLYLDRCLGPIDLSRVTESLNLWDSPVDVLAWPAALDELRLHTARLRGPLPPARAVALEDVELVDAVVGAGSDSVSLSRCTGRVDLSAARAELALADCDLEISGVADAIAAVFARDSRLRGISGFPGDPRNVRNCAFV